MDNIDYLYESAIFYKEHLVNRRFEIVIKRKHEERVLEVLFLPMHFYHLIGLHKLSDLPFLKRNVTNIYKEILSKKITYSDIEKSDYINEIYNRLVYHEEMLNILNADSLFFRALHGRFKGISADCVLTKSIDDSNYTFLFFKQSQDVYIPCSFFTRSDQIEYTKEGTRWQILSITEISKR